jgi:hypothetical protein
VNAPARKKTTHMICAAAAGGIPGFNASAGIMTRAKLPYPGAGDQGMKIHDIKYLTYEV